MGTIDFTINNKLIALIRFQNVEPKPNPSGICKYDYALIVGGAVIEEGNVLHTRSDGILGLGAVLLEKIAYREGE